MVPQFWPVVYISALALFFIIGWVASFKVIPTWLNNTVPAMFPLLETVLELTFRECLEYARRIIFNRRFVIEPLSFEWFFEFWKQPKVTGGYIRTVRRLSNQCDTCTYNFERSLNDDRNFFFIRKLIIMFIFRALLIYN